VSFAATTLCIASKRVFVVVYRHSPENFGYTLVLLLIYRPNIFTKRINVLKGKLESQFLPRTSCLFMIININ